MPPDAPVCSRARLDSTGDAYSASAEFLSGRFALLLYPSRAALLLYPSRAKEPRGIPRLLCSAAHSQQTCSAAHSQQRSSAAYSQQSKSRATVVARAKDAPRKAGLEALATG